MILVPSQPTSIEQYSLSDLPEAVLELRFPLVIWAVLFLFLWLTKW